MLERAACPQGSRLNGVSDGESEPFACAIFGVDAFAAVAGAQNDFANPRGGEVGEEVVQEWAASNRSERFRQVGDSAIQAGAESATENDGGKVAKLESRGNLFGGVDGHSLGRGLSVLKRARPIWDSSAGICEAKSSLTFETN